MVNKQKYGLSLQHRAKYALNLPGAPAGGNKAPKNNSGSGGSGGGSSGGGSKAVSGKISEKQENAVRTMQQVMNKLNTDLQDEQIAKNAHKIVVSVNNGAAPQNYPDHSSIMMAAQSWGATAIKGRSGSAPEDGIWGPSTKSALGRIKQFVSDTNIGNVLIQEGQGTRPYQEMDDASVIKAAQENITNLGRLFGVLGMTVPSQVGQQGGSGYVLDKVPRQLTLEAAQTEEPWPQYYVEQIVTVGDLSSFSKFFKLIMSLRYTECRPLQGGDLDAWNKNNKSKEKSDAADGSYESDCLECDLKNLAEEILNASLFRFGQEEPTEVKPSDVESRESPEYNQDKNYRGSAKGDTTPVVPQTASNGICFYTIEDILKWFYARASSVYAQLERYRTEAMPHPIRKGSFPNDMDLRAANAYRSAISNLWDEWEKIRDEVMLKTNPKEPIVTYNMIYDASSSKLGDGLGGRDRQGRGGRGGRPGSGGGWTMSGYAQEGPISDFMRLERLVEIANGTHSNIDEAAANVRALSRDNRIPEISLRAWRSNDWQRLAYSSVIGKNESEQLYNFANWARSIRNLIRALYVDWEGSVNPADAVVQRQHREWDRWNDAIRAVIATATKDGSAMGSSEGRDTFEPASTTRQREEQGGNSEDRYGKGANRAPNPNRPLEGQDVRTRASERAKRKDRRTEGFYNLDDAKARREAYRRQRKGE